MTRSPPRFPRPRDSSANRFRKVVFAVTRERAKFHEQSEHTIRNLCRDVEMVGRNWSVLDPSRPPIAVAPDIRAAYAQFPGVPAVQMRVSGVLAQKLVNDSHGHPFPLPVDLP